MLVWETHPSMRDSELDAAFADAWCAIPKIVFSRTLDSVQGNARLAEASLAEEAAAALDATDKRPTRMSRSAAPAWLPWLSSSVSSTSCACIRKPVIVGGGTPFLPPVTENVLSDLIETRTFGSRVIYERYELAEATLELAARVWSREHD